MADDRMKNEERDRDMGGRDKDYGQQTPGRGIEDHEQFDKKGGGQGTRRDLDDDDLDSQQGGRSGQTGRRPDQGGMNQ